MHAELQHSFIDQLRELCGGGVFQMPADISVMDDPELAQQFTTFWQTPQGDAVTRMKLFKLAWDMVGTEFAGRHLQYEKFYAGASFIIRNHSYRETDWGEFNTLVEDLMASYDYPTAAAGRREFGRQIFRRWIVRGRQRRNGGRTQDGREVARLARVRRLLP